MYKRVSIIVIAAVCAILISSCRSALSVIPQATNTVATAGFKDLNLERKDYVVLNTISAEATITAHFTDGTVKVEDQSGEFGITWKKDWKTGVWTPEKIKGIMCLGYLSNDYSESLMGIPPRPDWIVRRLAIYRLINAAKVAGGDGVIEPTISTNVEQGRGNRDIVYKTTVSAKVIKIKADSK